MPSKNIEKKKSAASLETARYRDPVTESRRDCTEFSRRAKGQTQRVRRTKKDRLLAVLSSSWEASAVDRSPGATVPAEQAATNSQLALSLLLSTASGIAIAAATINARIHGLASVLPSPFIQR